MFQLVGFPLTSLAHSGVDGVPRSPALRAWDLDRNRGGLRSLMPQPGTGSLDGDGPARGDADER